MQTIILKGTVVPGGWRYLDPDTTAASGKPQWITAPSWGELLVAVKKRRTANSLPIGLLFEQEIEEQICSRMPPGICQQTDETQRRRAAQIARPSISEVDSFTRLLVKRWITGKGLVSQEEATAHARSCIGCYYNDIPNGCSSCTSGASTSAVEFALGTRNKHTPHDSSLKACLLCKCHLRAKVWAHADEIRETSPEVAELLPIWCWIVKKTTDPSSDKLLAKPE